MKMNGIPDKIKKSDGNSEDFLLWIDLILDYLGSPK
jgi:hypothetical protein